MNLSEKLIARLKELKEEETISSYSHIKNILKNQIIPVPLYEYKPYRLIRYRRHNKGEEFFNYSHELSYRTDILDIHNFGRANEPGQGMFYCNDNKNQETGIAEAVSIFRGNKDSKEEILTIGAWDLNKPLNLVLILPIEQNFGKNSDFDKIKEYYNRLENSKEFEDLKRFNDFLANEFTLDLEKHKSNYKITCAFTNYIREKFPEIDGIIYSSVKSEYNGTNIVLWPEVVNEKLDFVAARKSIFKRVFDKKFVEVKKFDNIKYDKKSDKILWK
jgi:hypothetical protein